MKRRAVMEPSEAGTPNGQEQIEGGTERFRERHHARRQHELREIAPLAGRFFAFIPGMNIWGGTRGSPLSPTRLILRFQE